MKHVMIDLETLGHVKNSAFLSIAAVQFDPVTGNIGKQFLANVSLNSSLEYGLTVTEETISWWLKQKPEVAKLMFDEPRRLPQVLIDFRNWFNDNFLIYPWGNGASFDLALLTNAYEKCFHLTDRNIPWKYSSERCYRTFKNLGSSNQENIGNAHDPVSDCIYQIKVLADINKQLGFPVK